VSLEPSQEEKRKTLKNPLYEYYFHLGRGELSCVMTNVGPLRGTARRVDRRNLILELSIVIGGGMTVGVVDDAVRT